MFGGQQLDGAPQLVLDASPQDVGGLRVQVAEVREVLRTEQLPGQRLRRQFWDAHGSMWRQVELQQPPLPTAARVAAAAQAAAL